MKQAKIVLGKKNTKKKYHQLRKRLLKRVFIYSSDKILKIIPTRPNDYS